ncbi:MAG: hypothetical protein NVS1B13_25620 [Flavisolibacter sp.]
MKYKLKKNIQTPYIFIPKESMATLDDDGYYYVGDTDVGGISSMRISPDVILDKEWFEEVKEENTFKVNISSPSFPALFNSFDITGGKYQQVFNYLVELEANVRVPLNPMPEEMLRPFNAFDLELIAGNEKREMKYSFVTNKKIPIDKHSKILNTISNIVNNIFKDEIWTDEDIITAYERGHRDGLTVSAGKFLRLMKIAWAK